MPSKYSVSKIAWRICERFKLLSSGTKLFGTHPELCGNLIVLSDYFLQIKVA